jgi:hypothetical protein
MVAWSGDLAWGPRYLVPCAALITIPLAFVLDHWLSNARRYRAALAGAGMVAIIAIGVQVSGVAVDYFAVAQNHHDVYTEANYFKPGHSQFKYHAKAVLDSLNGRDPYPHQAMTDPTQMSVPPFDFWWVNAFTWRDKTELAISGVVVLPLAMVGAAVILFRPARRRRALTALPAVAAV